MAESWIDCPNCGATLESTSPECDRCHERRDAPGTGRPRFSAEAREIGLGGLLKLYEAQGRVVRYVGRCPGGAFGLDEAGTVVWVEDLHYLASLECEGSVLKLNGKLADVDTGKLL